MDLKSYIDSEVEEERQLGHSPSGVAVSDADGYPGDPSVHIADTDVVVERTTDLGANVECYVARPEGGDGSMPVIVVIHENKGLVPYIENTARRLAKEGYVSVAPDLLSQVGGTASFEDPADATKALGEIAPEDIVADVRAVVSGLSSLENVQADRIGIVGFCYGGGVAWRVMTKDPRLTAGVPFYGPTPPVEDVPGIEASVLAIYGELDERITSMLPDIRGAMEQHGKSFESVVLPGSQHAFHNDTNPDRYNADAAGEAWGLAVGFLNRHLKGA